MLTSNNIADMFEKAMLKELPNSRFDDRARLTKVESDIQDAVYFNLRDAGVPVEYEGEVNGVNRIDLVIMGQPIEIKQDYTNFGDRTNSIIDGWVKKDCEKLAAAGGGFFVFAWVGIGDDDHYKYNIGDCKKEQLEETWTREATLPTPDVIRDVQVTDKTSVTLIVKQIGETHETNKSKTTS